MAEDGIGEHQYTDWIRTYSSSDFLSLVQQLESLVDRFATASTPVHSTYRYAMLYEQEFFQAAWQFGE